MINVCIYIFPLHRQLGTMSLFGNGWFPPNITSWVAAGFQTPGASERLWRSSTISTKTFAASSGSSIYWFVCHWSPLISGQQPYLYRDQHQLYWRMYFLKFCFMKSGTWCSEEIQGAFLDHLLIGFWPIARSIHFGWSARKPWNFQGPLAARTPIPILLP
jgi:hypothetical protein